eukprot:1139018-Pelagomonas_calceolata.AAC.4
MRLWAWTSSSCLHVHCLQGEMPTEKKKTTLRQGEVMRGWIICVVLVLGWLAFGAGPGLTVSVSGTFGSEESSSDENNMEEDEADISLEKQEAVVQVEIWEVGVFHRAMFRL